MARLCSDHVPALKELHDAAERRRIAEADLERLAVNTVRAGVPALHVADAAGIGRATLYRWLANGVNE